MERPILVGCLLVLASAVAAQEDEVGKPYWVSTPAETQTALRNAAGAIAEKDWTGAAHALHRLFRPKDREDKRRSMFVKSGRRGRYVGARQRAVDLMRTLPPPGREEYERLYGPDAEARFLQALANSDLEGLLEVVRHYEATEAGFRSVVALADSALLRGRPAEARLLLARVRRLHPEQAARAAVLARLAMAAARDHAQGGPPPHGPERSEKPASFPSLDDHAWPMMGGNATRTRIAPPALFQEEQYCIEMQEIHQRSLDIPETPRSSWQYGGSRMDYQAWEERWSEYNPVHPVLARGYMVYSNGRQVMAVNLYNGEEEWRYPPLTETETNGRTNLSTVFSPVVADGVVYASVEVPVPFLPQRLQTIHITYYIPARRLVALDLESGEVLWSHEDARLPKRSGAELKSLSVVGPPLVRGDRVYVGAARSEGTFHNYLMAVDRRTGRLIYAAHISTGQQELNLFGRQLQECACTPVAEVDGILYYGTNLGVFAAVDALLGTPLWATTYPVTNIPATFIWYEAPRRWPQHDNGPPVVAGDQVIVAPADSHFLFALDRFSGRVLWRKRSVGSGGDRITPQLIQGADNERVYVSGAGGVAALWLRNGTGTRLAGAEAWRVPYPRDGDAGVGRGFLSEDGLWVPTYQGIYRFDAVNGKVTADYPRLGRDEDHPVNIVWGDGVLVSAGREFLCARYAESDVIRLAKERMLAHPDAIGPILGAADIYLATGRLSLAVEHYRNARIRATAHGVPAAERRAREGLHRALLRRAEEAMESEPERAPAKFDAAFTAAPSAVARLRARLRLDAILAARSGAEINEWRLKNLRELEREYGDQTLEEGGRTVRGWALRQMAGILVERRQIKRALAVLHRLIEADPESADGRRASGEIGAILENEGRQHYQPYEKRARKVFESAIRSGDLEALERGLAIYANAEATSDATLELARRRLKRGEAEAAATSLRRFLLEHPGARQVPEALMLMVRALDARRSYGQAYSALQRLRRRHGDALVTRTDGARVPARELVAEWLRRDPYPGVAKSARRRDLQAGLVERFQRSFEGEFVDVPDLQGQLPPALKEAVLLKAGSSLAAIDSRTGGLMYRIEFEEYEPLSPVVLVGDRLLALNERHVYVCDARSGRTLARHAPPDGAKGLMLLEHQGQVFLLYQRSGLRPQVGVAALHPEDGSPLWSSITTTEAARERVRPGYVVA
ncbi:MAG: outer membrane protein assembly factor BamB family protein, partial [Planctomycetota bacterium]